MRLRRSLMRWSLGLMISAVAVTLVSSGDPPRITAKPTAMRHHPVRIRRQRDQQQWESSNWSGYAVTGPTGSVTDVKASWKVPMAVCQTNSSNGSDGYSAFWVGIDGWSSSTVEQIGTDSDCVSLSGAPYTPTYYAWFEFYPQNSYYIEFSQCKSLPGSNTCVAPGDVISAEVKWTGSSTGGGHGRGGGGSSETFTVTITDVTQNWTYNTSSSVPNAQQSSAEWIAETPCCQRGGKFLPLADFGAAYYGSSTSPTWNFTNVADTSWATVGQTIGPIGSFGNNVQESTMVSDTSCSGASCPVMAQPSPLSPDGSSFSVAWMNAGP